LNSCATAARNDLPVLHDDSDFTTAARCLPDLRERDVHNVPPPTADQAPPAGSAGQL
jgi:hypothetical protein